MKAPLPVGPPVEPARVAPPAPDKTYTGRVTTLRPVRPDEDAAALYDDAHGSDEARALWTYMAYGPFESRDAMRAWLGTCARSTDPLFLTVLASGRPAGMASFMNIVPAMRRLELGHIWYAPASQRTRVNTEAMYLMLGEAFDALGYRRVEWKCDALNARSRAAARRLGLRLRGRLPEPHDREGTQPRHRLVRDDRRRLVDRSRRTWSAGCTPASPACRWRPLNARFCRPGVEDE